MWEGRKKNRRLCVESATRWQYDTENEAEGQAVTCQTALGPIAFNKKDMEKNENVAKA